MAQTSPVEAIVCQKSLLVMLPEEGAGAVRDTVRDAIVVLAQRPSQKTQ